MQNALSVSMKMSWSKFCDQFRPSLIECDQLLAEAGIPLFAQDWTAEDVIRAEELLRQEIERRAVKSVLPLLRACKAPPAPVPAAVCGMRFFHGRILNPVFMPNKIPQMFEVSKVTPSAIYYRPVYRYEPTGRVEVGKTKDYCTWPSWPSVCLRLASQQEGKEGRAIDEFTHNQAGRGKGGA